MSYAAGMMDKRVQILARGDATDGEFGVNSEGAEYAKVGCVWAAVDFSRGMKSIREGAYDAYDDVEDILIPVDGGFLQRLPLVCDVGLFQVLQSVFLCRLGLQRRLDLGLEDLVCFVPGLIRVFVDDYGHSLCLAGHVVLVSVNGKIFVASLFYPHAQSSSFVLIYIYGRGLFGSS